MKPAHQSIHWYELSDKGEPVPIMQDYIEFIKTTPEKELSRRMYGSPFRVVGRTMVGKVKVCTDFLFLDHGMLSWGKSRILWESMAFGGKLDMDMDRCGGGRKKAVAMHWRFVRRVARKERIPIAKVKMGELISFR